MGNKMLTGVATPTNTSTYPPASSGIYPIGVWSIAFNPDGTKSTQCEFTLPTGGITSPAGNGNYAKITMIQPLGAGKFAVGFGVNNTSLSAGVAIVDSYAFIDDRTLTALESPMYEIGTPLTPTVVNTIQVNLVKNLLSGQQIVVQYRTRFDANFTTIKQILGDGTTNQYKITANAIGPTRYVQFKVQAATGGSGQNPNETMEIRNIIIS